MKKVILFFVLILLLGCKKDCPDCGRHGRCQDGQCLCDAHYTGIHCDEQVTPLLIQVQAITVMQLPATDTNGAGWDITSGPDLYVVILQNGNVLATTHDQWKQNAGAGASWSINLTVSSATSPITIELWDFDDFDADDYMGSVSFPIYFNTNGFPESILTDCPTCTVNFQLDGVTYL